MKYLNTEILNKNYSLDENTSNLPKNIYAIKVYNVDDDQNFEIAINNNGYCPNLNSEHEESSFIEYLSALEYRLIDEYFKVNKLKKPKEYYTICELMTNGEGDLYRYSKVNN
jgi:hypothetical protein